MYWQSLSSEFPEKVLLSVLLRKLRLWRREILLENAPSVKNVEIKIR